MPVKISRLRRWFAAAAMAVVLMVAGAYFYARHRVQNVLKQVPGKISAGIQQSAQGYTYSQSEQGRTLFKIQASKAIFKLNGRAELRGVTITLYGRDAGRFDQISGADFEYDSQSGDVTAQGNVQIDLGTNPAGLTSPDQAPPKDLKNPIHLETSNLVFNRKTGDAHTQERVDFHIAQASGSAMGVSYIAQNKTLNLDSQVQVTLADGAALTAAHGIITRDPRAVVLQSAHLQQGSQRGEANQATLFLSPENKLNRVVANGDVRMELAGQSSTQLRADQLELLPDQQGGNLRSAIFSGNVTMESEGHSPLRGGAERMVANFSGDNVLNNVHAEGHVHVWQPASASSSNGPAHAHTIELTSPAVDFYLAAGKRLTKAETSGAAQISILPVASHDGQTVDGQTVISAGKFTAQFDARGRLSAIHGAPAARIVNSVPGQPERISTSLSVDAHFSLGQGMETVVQQGKVAYVSGDTKVWADRARYTPATQILELSGSPRVLDQNMETTARFIRMNRATGEGFAEGEVKSTYNDLKPEPGGALLASSSPIHVTAQSMAFHHDPGLAIYRGGVRLWQDANVVSAPSIEFDRNRRSITAQGSDAQPVSTVLMDPGKHNQTIPTILTSRQLTYVDSERRAHYAGGVTAKNTDFTLTAQQMDVFMRARNQSSESSAAEDFAKEKLDRIVAQGQVVVSQPNRQATGDQLTYTAAEDKLVLTGGPPSIFDAERGKITGVSLTLFRGDDRVLVEGTDTSPSVTQTRVAR